MQTWPRMINCLAVVFWVCIALASGNSGAHAQNFGYGESPRLSSMTGSSYSSPDPGPRMMPAAEAIDGPIPRQGDLYPRYGNGSFAERAALEALSNTDRGRTRRDIRRTAAAEPITAGEPTYQHAIEPIPDDAMNGLLRDDLDYGPAYSNCDGPCHWYDPHRFWVRGEYLLWGTKGFSTPPLVTTSPVGTPRTDAGIVGLPTTSVLFGGNDLADSVRSGGRVRLGYWFDSCDTVGIEGTYFALATTTSNFSASSVQNPILARPFRNIEPGSVGNDAELVAYPNLFSGNISVNATSKLQGAEVLLRGAICHDCYRRFDFVAGWRYALLDESLVISDSKTALSGATGLAIGTNVSEFDSFATRNSFNGGVIGLVTACCRCRWWFETRTTLALGDNNARVRINGQATSSTPVQGGAPVVVTTPAGLLAQGTNIGTFTSNSFSLIPQFDVTLGYDLTSRLRATVGYSFMYWTHVARPGDQIDTSLNLSQLGPNGLVGAPRPAVTGTTSDFWAQGLTVGLAYRF
jgi:hypothetical protein